jgi:hypothetical protein
LLNSVGILRRQGHLAAGAEGDPAAGRSAGHDQQVVGSHAGDGTLNGEGRAVADLYHGNHRRYAYDNAQRRERRAQDIPAQRP